ncbi:unnamed protein product, partial [Brenthis ino]
MIPSNTICVSQEGPANALALNKDCSQVVIAGRNVFKVFSIGEDEFSEVCNLRVGKNLNLNFSSIDVAWSTIEENTLATAATNGAVVVWNLGRSGRSKQEHVFSDHKRTVNKVSFHLTEPALLISGSQDGMMKCFDLRMKEVARTFISNTESIRDVQFSPHQAHAFAAVSENGTVQLWDARRHERALHQFTAHSGPVFACDWHPDVPWLATASRDKTIKVWDIHARPNLEHTIYTIASVGHVKWRPQKKFQVASCALVLDCAVHVWDVRRPHVPLATFAEHRDVTTAIAWQAEPHAFLSTSRDCSLYRHRFSEAAHPVLWANPHGVALSARGELAHARPTRPLPALHPTAPDRYVPALGRKQPTAGSLSASAQATLERAFAGGAASALWRHTPTLASSASSAASAASASSGASATNGASATSDASPLPVVLACAREYRIRGHAPHVLAEHNARVAREHQRYMGSSKHTVSHVWEVVRAVYSARAAPAPAPPPPAPPPRRDPAPPPPYSAVEEEPIEEVEEWENHEHKNSGVLGLPTHSIYIPPARRAARDAPDDECGGWVSAASAHYVDVEAADWTLPDEAFPLRAPPAPPAPLAPPAPPHDAPAHEGAGYARAGGAGGAAAGASSPGGSSGSGSSAAPPSPTLLRPGNGSTEAGGAGEAGEALCVREARRGGALRAGPLLAAALRLHAALGDVQTAAVVCLALQDHRNDLLSYIDESMQEQWLLGYIELLQRHKMWNEATEVIRCAWVNSVWSISQQSTALTACCGRCGRRTRARAPCDTCAPRAPPDLCAVCHRAVRGLYAWCQGCAHGGHLLHMRAWAAAHRLCPAGCGHACHLG